MSLRACFTITVVLFSCLSLLAGQPVPLSGDLYKTERFSDDFSSPKLGKQWSLYKSSSLLKDGVLVGIEEKDGGHAAVHQLRVEPCSDLELTLDIKFEGSKSTNLTFNQHRYKETHAGHICRVIVSRNKVILRDGKTGVFNNEIFKKRKAGKKLDEQTQALLKQSEASFPVKLKEGKWYTVNVRIKGDLMQAFIDGTLVGSLHSPGIAHKTKDKIGLVTPKQSIHYDNLTVKVP
ncbi:family 16 glycoside hydrolase [uncultured Gimesia sp.]|uniref:family 16 glycoside hydrolase n=1 Tax=uncultured Gimesia sp. TaxID=1678688 RepID=UPI002629F2BA|nr:family 16 glycoside hydrolase [uncultured Gimesia sp.]